MHLETRIATLIFIPNLLLLFVAVSLLGALGAALIAALRSVAYIFLRSHVTGVSLFLVRDVVLHSGAVTMAALVWFLPVEHRYDVFFISTWVAAGSIAISLNFVNLAPPVKSLLSDLRRLAKR
jgi:hypothetical protein